jgi:hypothetical protein
VEEEPQEQVQQDPVQHPQDEPHSEPQHRVWLPFLLLRPENESSDELDETFGQIEENPDG